MYLQDNACYYCSFCFVATIRGSDHGVGLVVTCYYTTPRGMSTIVPRAKIISGFYMVVVPSQGEGKSATSKNSLLSRTKPTLNCRSPCNCERTYKDTRIVDVCRKGTNQSYDRLLKEEKYISEEYSFSRLR